MTHKQKTTVMKKRFNLPGILLVIGSLTLMSYEKSGFEMTEVAIDPNIIEVYQHNPIMIDASFKMDQSTDEVACAESKDFLRQAVFLGSEEEQFKGFLAAILASGI